MAAPHLAAFAFGKDSSVIFFRQQPHSQSAALRSSPPAAVAHMRPSAKPQTLFFAHFFSSFSRSSSSLFPRLVFEPHLFHSRAHLDVDRAHRGGACRISLFSPPALYFAWRFSSSHFYSFRVIRLSRNAAVRACLFCQCYFCFAQNHQSGKPLLFKLLLLILIMNLTRPSGR